MRKKEYGNVRFGFFAIQIDRGEGGAAKLAAEGLELRALFSIDELRRA